MLETPQILRTAMQHTAVIHLTIPRDQIRHVMGPALGELTKALADQGVAPAGAWFTHHLRMSPVQFDFEVSMPVATPIVAVGRVRPSVLPAATVARAIYTGPYEGLGAAWGEFDAWVRANGHTPAEDLWECYVAGPKQSADPSAWRTEFNRPLVV